MIKIPKKVLIIMLVVGFLLVVIEQYTIGIILMLFSVFFLQRPILK